MKSWFFVLMALLLLAHPCPALEVDAPAAVSQGRCFTVVLASPEGVAAAELRFLGRTVACYRGDDSFRGIAGTAPEQKPGVYPLSVIITRADGGRQELRREIKIAKAKFPFVSFWLKPAKKKIFTRDLIAEEWAIIERVLLVEQAEQSWEGRFALPAKGPTSMVFGTVERVNGKPTGRHRGYDIAVPIGTRVKAANAGKVVFARPLKAFGGTMVVDHGQGVHTLYFHLSKFLADVGQVVTREATIALSGNSGISSGPHLHWGLSVHNLRVDPAQWTKYAF
jgi:murein DD-endopeptidase MepM/ murein hydrolase activator NlpD